MKNKRENGEVVVEASIIVTLVVLLLTVMLYIGMVLYQQTLAAVMAHQTAANIAQVYSNNLKDPFTGYIDPEKVYQSITYNNMKDDSYMQVIEKKANIFSKYRLKSSQILVNGNASVDVDIVRKPNELLKSQIVVTVRDRYDVPLMGMFGTDGLMEFSSSGRADCVDILEYINGVQAIGNPEESNVSFLSDSKNCTVTFIPNRDNPSNSTTLTVLKGKTILSSNRYTHCVMPSTPTNGNFEFAGWADDANRSFTATTVVNEDKVVYGTWKCTVTLKAEGGKVNSAGTYEFKTIVGRRTTISNATRSGYHFKGWFTEKNGGGTRYLSNDTIITGDTVLYAKWECAHPSRYEAGRTGVICTGGTIYYKCTQCHADMGTGYYGGNGHVGGLKCNKKHRLKSYFNGIAEGGCGVYHSANTYCNACGVKHGDIYAFCVVCIYCHQSTGGLYCGNPHSRYTLYSRPSCTPVNDHAL